MTSARSLLLRRGAAALSRSPTGTSWGNTIVAQRTAFSSVAALTSCEKHPSASPSDLLYPLLASAAFMAAAVAASTFDKTTDCCGIVGVVTGVDGFGCC